VGCKRSIRRSLTDETSLVPLLATLSLKNTTFVAAGEEPVSRRKAILQFVERFVAKVCECDLVPGL